MTTTWMGHEACLTHELETLPIKALLRGPRLPSTISPTPNLPASPTICALGNPHVGPRDLGTGLPELL
jgi:hypothetical protein